jgi:hypothetical protein
MFSFESAGQIPMDISHLGNIHIGGRMGSLREERRSTSGIGALEKNGPILVDGSKSTVKNSMPLVQHPALLFLRQKMLLSTVSTF